METRCDALIMPTLLVSYQIGQINRVLRVKNCNGPKKYVRNIFPTILVDYFWWILLTSYFSTVNGENYLFRGCSPFNTDEISADNRLHDPVCNKWNNDENCKQQCDRDSFCNRGDMKQGKYSDKKF